MQDEASAVLIASTKMMLFSPRAKKGCGMVAAMMEGAGHSCCVHGRRGNAILRNEGEERLSRILSLEEVKSA